MKKHKTKLKVSKGLFYQINHLFEYSGKIYIDKNGNIKNKNRTIKTIKL